MKIQKKTKKKKKKKKKNITLNEEKIEKFKYLSINYIYFWIATKVKLTAYDDMKSEKCTERGERQRGI